MNVKRFTVLCGIAFSILLAIFVAGRYVWAVSTTDAYYGVITQPPKIGRDGEREIGLLAPGDAVAETINLEDFCILPFTRFCRFNTADLHNTFVVGQSYCVTAYGVRIGFLSIKPNMVEIISEHDERYGDCSRSIAHGESDAESGSNVNGG